MDKHGAADCNHLMACGTCCSVVRELEKQISGDKCRIIELEDKVSELYSELVEACK